MKQYQHDFIRLSLEENVLKFGEFTLKSGRKRLHSFFPSDFLQRPERFLTIEVLLQPVLF